MTNKKQYEEEYFTSTSEKGEDKYKVYLNFIKKSGIQLDNLDICDIGCASGELYKLLQLGNCRYKGVDISDYAIKECKNKFPNSQSQFSTLNVEKETLTGAYDIITMFDVIEHLRDLESINKVILNNLKSNGYFVLTTPNANNILRYLGKETTVTLDPTHTVAFSPFTLEFILKRMGLERVAMCTPYIFYFKLNMITSNVLYGGQIFGIFKKV